MESRDQPADVGAARHDDPDPASRSATPGGEAMLAALLDAGPEAVDHLLKAAQELLLAAKAVVDAGERAVEAHRSPAAEDPSAEGGRVRRIDLA